MVHLKGFFVPKFPAKYAGNSKNIVYRSSWELKMMRHCDMNPKITKWASEELHIYYTHPVSGTLRRYFPDFLIEVTENNKKRHVLVEVKPKSQTMLPKGKSKKALITFAENQAKWKAATIWCEQKGYEFKVLTEEHLGIPPNG